MDFDAVPATLRERLGPEATSGLIHVLELSHRQWSEDVIGIAAERFERRLAEATSSLRVQIAQTEAVLRHEIAQSEGVLRQEIGQVRQELGQADARLRQDLSQMEVRLLKWSFLFWIGQVVAISAIMAAMLRIVR